MKKVLDITGCIVTLDAIGTQKSIAAQIHAAEADYILTILTLKANHPTLFQQVKRWWQQTTGAGHSPAPVSCTTERGHHRTEIRKRLRCAYPDLKAAAQLYIYSKFGQRI